ncbi:Cation efflux protein [Trema orientale]|uniref:Cation efflux protein n=1 Tax=Trema orientale TaxID=63057 RepID=A0A2P5FHC7_TREOI|nr:Cation efflux protein [Trema orientale]
MVEKAVVEEGELKFVGKFPVDCLIFCHLLILCGLLAGTPILVGLKGFFRVEILGALISIQLIWLIAGILVYEAMVRLKHKAGEVNNGFLMFVVAAFGLVVNIIMALLLGHDHDRGHGEHDHGFGFSHRILLLPAHHQHEEQQTSRRTRKEAKEHKCASWRFHPKYWVMIGGGIIWYKPQWERVDSICTLIFSVIVVATTIKMLCNMIELLMESTPREIDATKLEGGLLEMQEAVAIHELHIWALTVGKILSACHVKITPEANADMVLYNVKDYITREYNINHVTIQIEHLLVF